MWMFCNYQINDIHKVIRHFLWFDGKDNRKWQSIKWSWCCLDKKMGGLGLKYLRLQGISLPAKCIFQALEGDEPWKILVRNNIRLIVPKKTKGWKYLPFVDLIAGKFPISPTGSSIFKSIWKDWESTRNLIANNEIVDNYNTIVGKKWIWWNLIHKDKPLALIQGCSIKAGLSKASKPSMILLPMVLSYHGTFFNIDFISPPPIGGLMPWLNMLVTGWTYPDHVS